jgi:aldehyde:ferredoxin oxidoreductase
MSGGYMGKVLWVDLSRREIKTEPLDEGLQRQFIGGYGIGVRLIFSRQRPKVDPLGPDNILGFLTGPLTGTAALSGTRFTVVGKSPLTGCWGDANSGGSFGAFSKFAGYDAVFFTGAADKPVYLYLDNEVAELRYAAHLWGRDTYATDDLLKAELGKDVAIACIGPSGEKLSLVSSIVHNKGSVAGRSGMGALMGSKELKAVVVRGNAKVPVADEERLMTLRRRYLRAMGRQLQMMRKYGTTFTTVNSILTGDSPIKNWTGDPLIDFKNAKALDGDAFYNRQLKQSGCYKCPVGCEALMKAGTGEFRYAAGSFRPEYETVAMLGSNCLVDNVEAILKANDLCNRYGIDTISTGSIMAFAMECYENGLINRSDTDGIEMTWGNPAALVAMIEKMAKREGFGDVLADGVKIAAAKIGRGADEFAIHIQGQEVPGHNPLSSINVTTTYITNATPARHTQGSEEHHSEGLLPGFDRKVLTGRVPFHVRGSNFQHSLMACGMCLFVNMTLPHAHAMGEFIAAVTGWDIDTEELVHTGERIANLRQAFNIREGLNPREFKIPGRILGNPVHTAGPLAGKTVDAETMVREYLTLMDWDLQTAKPSRQKLLSLGLEDVAAALWD